MQEESEEKEPSRAAIEDIKDAVDKLPAPSKDDGFPSRERLQEDARRLGDENAELKVEISKLKSDLATKQTLDSLLQPYAVRTFRFMCAYCVFVAIIIVYAGLKVHDFFLSDDVLKILVGSTAVSVVGLAGTVLTGVFIGARK